MSMLKYFIYGRKSSEDEDRQMLSIDAQLSELNIIARQNGLSVVGTFTESKSAKEPGREVFNDMLRRIERGEANAILTWKLDRLARNFDDGGKIIGLLQRGVIQEIRTFEKSYLPTDNVLMIAVEFGMANQYSRDLSVNVLRGIRAKVRRGVLSGKAPLGYFNEPKLRTIEPHPDYFAKVKRIMELFATGQYSLTAIQKELKAVGIVGERSKKPLPLSSIGNFLRNPFYYGVFLHKGEMHQGIHAPMITKKTFDEIQAALVTVGKPRKKRGDKGFLFLNFATCATCGHCVTGERHTKRSGRRYGYYRCSHKNKLPHSDDRSLIPEAKFAEEVKRNVLLVTIPDDWKEKFLAQIELWQNDEAQVRQQQVDRIKAELAALKTKIDRLNVAFTEGGIELAEFKELKNPLIAQKTNLEQKLARVEKGKASPIEPLKNFILEANQAKKWVFGDDWLEMKSFLQKVGLNREIRSQTLTLSFKKHWCSLAKTTVAANQAASESERNSVWWRRRELKSSVEQNNFS
jgi:DNA invertase Pin-like site-specific DNA recombinase